MYQIKQLPEDFIVKEINNLQFENQGYYSIFRLTKKDYNTLDALKLLSQKLKIPLKNLGFAGSKDKKAVTEQLISIRNINKQRVLNLKLKDLQLDFLGYNSRPITLGDLTGNYFEITVRNLDNFDFKTPKKMINYFDQQRFSSHNIEIGRSLIKKSFAEACKLLELTIKNNDFISALKLIPLKLLKMYVNAYQSYLWNETVKEVIKEKIKLKEIPLIGFATEIKNPGLKKIINSLLKKENLTLTDFIIKQIPELSLEGGSRKIEVKIKDFKVLEKSEDELNQDKKKIKISFTLPKGSYATLVIKNMFYPVISGANEGGNFLKTNEGGIL